MRRLQLIQNKCLRLATGCHSAASIDHLHSETEVLPVEKHLHLLSSQFLARAMQPGHPSHDVVALPPGPRQSKHTLASKCGPTVEPFLQNGTIPATAYKNVIKQIHTEIVGDAISNLTNNRVLNAPAPKINPQEAHLPRKTGATLSQLRSGHCIRLKDYMHRIGKADDDYCPSFRIASDSTAHLFNCTSHPTSLTPDDLWRRPFETASFLVKLPAFNDLPAIGPLPPP